MCNLELPPPFQRPLCSELRALGQVEFPFWASNSLSARRE